MFKKYLIIPLLLIILLYAIPTIVSSQDLSNAPKWEYSYAVPIGFKGSVARPTIDSGVVINGEGVDADGVSMWGFLNSMGDEGWELVTVNDDGSYIFKRQK